jgi:class 3 adenylate cyclase/tetratricopeptide (TPR) repeat protein
VAQAITVTVLFTDLVGSTRLADRLGLDAADALRRDHFAVLRDAVNAHGGIEVKSLGDGLMVVFSSVRAALDGAVAIQQQIERHNRGKDQRLQMRVGLSTGDTTTDDGDYFGPTVVEAARLCAAAPGGSILTTELVRLHGARTGHRFRPIGDRQLKGLPEPITVVELDWSRAPATSPVPVPRRLSRRPPGGFVGHELDKARLLAAYKAVSMSEGRRVLLLSGDAGIGKTTLASEVARTAHDDGAIVLYGRCDEELGIPYQPFTEALRHYVTHAPQSVLRSHVGRHGDVLARLVPALSAIAPTSAPSRDPDTERHLLYEAVVHLLSAAAADAPVVIVLDDLHWADRATLLLLRHLVASPDLTDVLIIASFREPGIARIHPLGELRTAMRREVDVEHLLLQGLDDIEMVALLEAVGAHRLDRREVELAHLLRRETDGNPFFAAEIVRHLAEVGLLDRVDEGRMLSTELETAGLPESVRDVVGQRVARLGDRTEEVLRVAAVIGREFDLEVLAALTGTSEDELAELLDRAAAAALLVETGNGHARYSFGHALVRLTLYEDLGAARCKLVHQQVAETLEALCGGDPGPRIGELAWHWVAASASTDVAKAIEYCRLAGDAALDALAGNEAVRWYADALRLLDRDPSPDDRLRAQLLVSLGDAQHQCGDPAHRETLLDAANLAVRVGDTGSLVRAALTNYRGWHSIPGRVDAERVEALETALTGVGDAGTPERARLLKQLSVELSYSGDYARCRALDDEAVQIARRLGDPATLLHVLIRGQAGCWGPDTLGQRLAASREAVQLAEQVGDPNAACWAYTDLAAAAYGDANVDEADRAARRRDELAEQSGQPVHRWRTKVMQSARVLLAGDLAGAEALASEALQIGKESGQPDAMSGYVINICSIRWHQGKPNEFIPALEKTLADFPTKHGFYGMLARSCLDAGDEERARELVAFGMAGGFNPPWDIDWLVTMAMWSDAVIRLRDVDSAALIYERLAPWHGQIVMVPSMVDSCVAHYLGALAAVLGEGGRAREHFSEALAIHTALRAPFHVARTQLEWARTLLAGGGPADAEQARTLLAGGGPADAEQARTLLEEACSAAVRHGYTLVGREGEALRGGSPVR